MIVKVCGMREGGNISDVIAAGADWIGMIFWPKSPRYVQMVPSLTGTMPDKPQDCSTFDTVKAKRVGVFVNDSAQNIITRVVNYKLDLVQLHGDESPTFIRNLRSTMVSDINPNVKFIKAISIENKDDTNRCSAYEDLVDYFLFDTKCKERGGCGQHFDWSALEDYHGNTPFLLSGGIGPGDAEDIKGLNLPSMVGVDINSHFETEPGVKDIGKVGEFISKLR